MTKHDKNIDIFDYDCSENHEIMVVLMDLEAETLSESKSYYARPAQISFRADFVKIMDLLPGEGSNLDEIVAEQIG